MTRKPPMNWKGYNGELFEDLLRAGMPLTRIHAHFPECTYRQIEYRAENLIKTGFKRPKRLHGKQVDKNPDFTQDNIEVGPRA